MPVEFKKRCIECRELKNQAEFDLQSYHEGMRRVKVRASLCKSCREREKEGQRRGENLPES